jgi:hypothetical protein
MNLSNINPELMQKLASQGVLPGNDMMDAAPKIAIMDSTQANQPRSIMDPTVQTKTEPPLDYDTYMAKKGIPTVTRNAIVEDSVVIAQQYQEVPVVPVIQQEAPRRLSVSEQLRMLEEEERKISRPQQTQQYRTPQSEIPARAKSFLDEFGNETWYVENISDGHIALSDLDITIPRNKVANLLGPKSLEELRKSSDLRLNVSGETERPMLRRLTPEEFLEKRRIEIQQKKQIAQMKAGINANGTQMQNPNNPQQLTPRIRPTVLSKLEKLRLYSVPGNAHLGLTPVEFAQWALSENLSHAELEFVISHPNVSIYNDVLQALYTKKANVI